VFGFDFGMISSGSDPSIALLTMMAGVLLTELAGRARSVGVVLFAGAPAPSEAKHQRTDLPPSAPVDVPACPRSRDHRLLILDNARTISIGTNGRWKSYLIKVWTSTDCLVHYGSEG
jgi:hypothetical protein